MRITRVFAISDLHLGGAQPAMMSHASELAAFVDGLPAKLRPDEALELVIAGDFVDFLAIAMDGEQEAWTACPERAVRKLYAAMKGADAPVYRALGRLVGAGHRLTLIVGNHDLELAIPAVQRAFCEELGASRHQILFVDDGQALRIGNALFEHGNRYDGANVNDWGGLRAIVSHWSRGETPPNELDVSAGSRIVEKVVNPLKARYPFIDILQPQGELVGYLLLAMEPSLKCDFAAIRRMLVGAIRRALAPAEGPPRGEKKVGASVAQDTIVGRPLRTDRLDRILEVDPVSVAEQEVGVRRWFQAFLTSPGDNLAHYLQKDAKIPAKRLAELRQVITEMVDQDDTLNPAGETEQYGRNAKRICNTAGVEVVVMGHTHKARHVGTATKATYINTGAWADFIRVPREALAPTVEGANQLQRWLRDLYCDRGARSFQPHWADLRIEADGTVSEACLCPTREDGR